MSLIFVLRSFDGVPGGATTFDLYLEAGTHAATSAGAFNTVDTALAVVSRLVSECRHGTQYASDLAVDPDSWQYIGLFPDPAGGPPWAHTAPTDTEAEARQLIDTIVAEIRQLGEQIPYTLAPYDGLRELDEPGNEHR
jgi:hypothetical protein